METCLMISRWCCNNCPLQHRHHRLRFLLPFLVPIRREHHLVRACRCQTASKVTTDSAACLFSVPRVAAITPPESVADFTAALAAGNEQAFCNFHAAYGGRLLRYAL